MLLARHQKTGPNRYIKARNRSIENMLQFKYLDTTVTNQNLIQEGDWFWLCLLPFCPEAFVFLSAVQTLKDYNIKDYNFGCGSLRV
jgi:hypothetical protein